MLSILKTIPHISKSFIYSVISKHVFGVKTNNPYKLLLTVAYDTVSDISIYAFTLVASLCVGTNGQWTTVVFLGLAFIHVSTVTVVRESCPQGLVSTIDLSVSRVRFARKALAMRSCFAQFHPKYNAFKGVSKQLCVYHLYRNVFLAQTRIRSPFFPRLRKAFLTP